MRCKTNWPVGAIGRDCRAGAINFCNELSEGGHIEHLYGRTETWKCLSLSSHAPPRRDHPGCSTAEVGYPGGTYKLPCICITVVVTSCHCLLSAQQYHVMLGTTLTWGT